MAFSSCFSHPQISLKMGYPRSDARLSCSIGKEKSSNFTLKSMNTELFGQHIAEREVKLSRGWSFLGGSKAIIRPKHGKVILSRKSTGVYASWLTSPQIASGVFTLGTAAVLPFYTLMVVAPTAELTKKTMESSIPYVMLGLLYGYLLYLSWTPDTMRLMFASKYWLPELPGIAKMFSNEMTLASAWLHLLAVDLFAARQVYNDGLENRIETRHSVSLCLLFCPIGIIAHFITKALTESVRKTKGEIH
ncbi:hypothetical protein LguiA_014113 [Lonicera macranthoides]